MRQETEICRLSWCVLHVLVLLYSFLYLPLPFLNRKGKCKKNAALKEGVTDTSLEALLAAGLGKTLNSICLAGDCLVCSLCHASFRWCSLSFSFSFSSCISVTHSHVHSHTLFLSHTRSHKHKHKHTHSLTHTHVHTNTHTHSHKRTYSHKHTHSYKHILSLSVCLSSEGMERRPEGRSDGYKFPIAGSFWVLQEAHSTPHCPLVPLFSFCPLS